MKKLTKAWVFLGFPLVVVLLSEPHVELYRNLLDIAIVIGFTIIGFVDVLVIGDDK